MKQLLPQGTHSTPGTWVQLGIQAQPLLGNTDSTQGEISFRKGLRTPLLPPVFGNLRGTPQTRDVDAAQPKKKMRKSTGKGQRKHSAFGTNSASWACPAQARGIWNSLRTTLGYCTWQAASNHPTEPRICHFPHPEVHSFPSSSVTSMRPHRAR